jgi:RNA polymerase primary sigma factor
VVTVGRRYAGDGLRFTDLINEGNSGLIQATNRSDRSPGVKFIASAARWIGNAIAPTLAEQAGTTSLLVKQPGILLDKGGQKWSLRALRSWCTSPPMR